jgi:hypothetical protein
VQVKNTSDTRKIDYESWGDTSRFTHRHLPRLKDNFGNRYGPMGIGFGIEVIGMVKSASIHPGEEITEVMVFEKPIAKAGHLGLELPPSAFDGKGEALRFRIPASMIRR